MASTNKKTLLRLDIEIDYKYDPLKYTPPTNIQLMNWIKALLEDESYNLNGTKRTISVVRIRNIE